MIDLQLRRRPVAHQVSVCRSCPTVLQSRVSIAGLCHMGGESPRHSCVRSLAFQTNLHGLPGRAMFIAKVSKHSASRSMLALDVAKPDGSQMEASQQMEVTQGSALRRAGIHSPRQRT